MGMKKKPMTTKPMAPNSPLPRKAPATTPQPGYMPDLLRAPVLGSWLPDNLHHLVSKGPQTTGEPSFTIN